MSAYLAAREPIGEERAGSVRIGSLSIEATVGVEQRDEPLDIAELRADGADVSHS